MSTATDTAADPATSTALTTDWLTVGARVATLRSDWKRTGFAPVFAHVSSIGKRTIVLDDGQKFHATRLDRAEGGTWGWTVKILPVDNPAVIQAAAYADYQERLANAKKVVEDWRFGSNGTQPVDAILALAALTGVEDEIKALFERPRPNPTLPNL